MGSRLEKNSAEVRKRIESHKFEDEQGEEYSASSFGGFTDYMRRKKLKLQNLDAEIRSQSTDKPPIFRGIVVHVNGYTQPSLSDLHTLVVSHGGGFLQYLDGKTSVTHVIASNLTPKKRVDFAKYRIVKPAWVVDSVQAGTLLPWESYRLVDEGVTQKVLAFEGGKMVSQSNTQRSSYRDQTVQSWCTPQASGVARSMVKNMNPNSEAMASLAPAPKKLDDENQQVDDADHNLDFQTLDDFEMIMYPEEEANIEAVDNELEGLKPSADVNASSDRTATGITAEQPQAALESGAASEVSQLNPPETRKLTAEEHNAILLQNPHLAKSSTANPDFLNQYYRESRLHHLSTWKAELKAQIQSRAAEKSSRGKQLTRLSRSRRYVMHIDFDSFFAAVSLRKNPQLKDQPVAIAHGTGPGSEIASCNYPARKFGIKNGMWMKGALQLCPQLKVLPYDFPAYEEASRHFYDSILAIEGTVQSISIDEALLDVSQQCIEAGGSDGRVVQEGSIYREQCKANELAETLRDSIRAKTGCEVSIGIGNNILLAKVALRKAKPAGQHLIKPEDVLDFIGELLVTDLPGVAYSIGGKLEEIGVRYVKDIRSLTKERLLKILGPKTGEKLWDYSRGIDRTEVGEQVIRRSVSAEINWGIRFVTQQQAEEFVQCLCDELHRRLLDQAVKGRQLTMKIMRKAADAGMDPPKNLGHGKCDVFNKSVVLGVATHDKEVLGKEAISILRGYGFPPGELRGLGVQMQKLESLKPVSSITTTSFDSSQRRLQFKKPAQTLSSPKTNTEKSSLDQYRTSPRQKDDHDPIEDIASPERRSAKHSVTGPLDHQDFENDGTRKPLNIGGTQFILPTQIDPDVLVDLPSDIRAKLARPPRHLSDDIKQSKFKSYQDAAKPQSFPHYKDDGECNLHSQTQLDPEILKELPPDVRDEVLSHYRIIPNNSVIESRGQSVSPQSLNKSKGNSSSEKLVLTPSKRSKVSSFLNKPRQKPLASGSTLTQTNFVSSVKDQVVDGDRLADLGNLSESVLEELPEHIRLEVQAEQKRQRLLSKSGLALGSSKKKQIGAGDIDSGGQARLQLAPLPDKLTFTSRKLSTLPELRTAMSAWVAEFSDSAEGGPFEEDVMALADYLHKVVTIELDLAKAVDVVNWVIRMVQDQPHLPPSLDLAWKKAIGYLENEIQAALQERGLPPVDFVHS